MYLKKLELSGFKSFADRTVIEFDQGLTAVVGPNGSGKSNITEAIRWVLGEQSAKNLRGGKMPDIIFAGTAIRKPLNIAEVTVVLDNEERFLPLDFSEISVTRRLHRSGESEFFINKQACRLKDIIELFMDSGLGKESFSIISQGKVEAIFNSKPEDRRGIFEEAAGVLKYKQRKKQAEQKLFETEDNLNRVQDIVYELENQLEPLAEQSATAKEFLQLKQQFVDLDIGVNVKEILSFKEQWEETNHKIEHLQQELGEVTANIQEQETTLETLRTKRAQLDQAIDQKQALLLQTTEAYEQAEGQRNVLAERSKNTEKTTADYQAQLATIRTKQEQVEKRIIEINKQLKEKEQVAEELRAQLVTLTKEMQFFNKSAKERLEELRSEYVEVMQEQANQGNDLKHLERQYQQEASKNQQVMSKYEQLTAKQAEFQTKMAQVTEQLEQKSQQLVAYREQFTQTQKNYLAAKDTLTTTEKQMYDAMGILQQGKARLKSLKELQENYAGFYQGVRAILKAKEELSGILGAVAEILQVPENLTLAIETALGSAMQHVVVADEKSARAAITHLKQKRLGRATFLPLSTIKPRHLPNNIIESLRNSSGFVGVASELVQFDAKFEPIAKSLLGNTILAKDLKAANELARQVHYQYRIVSLEGDVMNPGGSMTGGAGKKGREGQLFHQNNEIQTLEVQVEQMTSDLKEREKHVQSLKNQVLEIETALEKVRAQGEQARSEEQSLQSQLERYQMEAKQIERELQAFEYEAQELKTFLAEYKTRKVELTKRLDELQTKRNELDELMNQTDEAANQAEEKKASLQAQINQIEANIAVVEEQKTHLDSQLKEQQTQLVEWQMESQKIEQNLALLQDDSSTHHETKESLMAKMQELQQKKSDLQAVLEQHKEERQQVQEQMNTADQALTNWNQQQAELLETKTQAEVLKDRAANRLESCLNYLREEYQLTFEAAQAKYELSIAVEEAKNQAKTVKKAMDALGPINLAAIEQHAEVSERYEFLVTQRDDLLAAKDRLFATMSEMDEIVKEKFGEIFTAINEKFQTVFPNMFGGGHAELKLTDPTDLLQTGIEIVAQPPGKKLQSLSLLSGGERALTAIALLFAIIQVRPVPFCILDEVEAALDEANVARFGHYLSSFEKRTQFIVITHRKGTMESADVLYGVTMQESGVSKIVSVRLEELKEEELTSETVAN